MDCPLFWGKVSQVVRAEDYSLSESASEGGFCKVSIAFIEKGQSPYPRKSKVISDLIGAVSQAVGASASAQFAAEVRSTGYSFISGIEQAVDGLIQIIDNFVAPVVALTDVLNRYSEARDRIRRKLSNLSQRPQELADELQAAINLFLEKPKKETINGLAKAAQETPDNPVGCLGSALLLSASVQAASEIDYDTPQDAYFARIQISQAIQKEEKRCGQKSSELYKALVDLRLQLAKAVPGDQEFDTVEVRTKSVFPLLVILHENRRPISDIQNAIARNQIRNPLFVPNGEKLIL